MSTVWFRASRNCLAGLGVVLVLSAESRAEQAGDVSREGTIQVTSALRSVLVLAKDEALFSAPDGASRRRGTAEQGAYLPLFASQRGPGCSGSWLLIGPLAWLCSDQTLTSDAPSLQPDAEPQRYETGLPLSYYKVGELGARAYSKLLDKDEGVPVAELEPGFIIGIRQIAKQNNEPFGLSNKGQWIALSELLPLKVPTFHGVEIHHDLARVAWVSQERAPVFSTPASGSPAATLARLTFVGVLDRVTRQGQAWLRTGEHAWMRERDLRRPTPAPVPSELLPGERWIDVDSSNQVLTAYQGHEPVFATLVSTGKGGGVLGTPKGHFRIWVKLRTSDMTNLEDEDANRYYAILDVPWVMYFKEGYGLHAAFWHDSFGSVRSHGCINLAPLDAQRLFHWAGPRLPAGWSVILPAAHDPGTLVVVH